MLVTGKLICGLFGDMSAVNFISTFARGLRTSKKQVIAKADPQREDGCLAWSCEITIHKADDVLVVYPLTIALIKPGLDVQQVVLEMGFDAFSCLRVVGDASKHHWSDGLVTFLSRTINAGQANETQINEAHLRNFTRYPLTGSAQLVGPVRLVANQLLESFVINDPPLLKKVGPSQPRPWSRHRKRRLEFVEDEVFAAAST